MADEQQQGDYSQEDLDSFGFWIELGARNPDHQWIIDRSPRIQWERTEPSGSPWVQRLLRNPLPLLLEEKVPYVHERSRITTTILHHHRGLNRRIIRITATVEKDSGDVALVLDKENPDSH